MPFTFLLFLAGIVLACAAPLALVGALASLASRALRPLAFKVLEVAFLSAAVMGAASLGMSASAPTIGTASGQLALAHAAVAFSMGAIVQTWLLLRRHRARRTEDLAQASIAADRLR
jgi:hypothetical protein